MFRNRFLSACILAAAPLSLAAQSFILSPQSSAGIPTGPVTGLATLSAARDAQSNLYVLAGGLTNSCAGSPPICFPGPASVLVKLNPQTAAPIFQETLPTPATAMAVDPAGNIYLATGNIIQKLSADARQILYSKTIGGPTLTFQALALDASGRLYLSGGVGAGDLPATTGSFLSAPPPGAYAFAMRLTPSAAIDYATYLGDAPQNPYALAVDQSGAAFVAWTSNSTSFASTPPAQPNGASFLVRLSPDGSKLLYATSPSPGIIFHLAADPAGHATVALQSAYGAGITVAAYNPDGSPAFARNLPGALAAGLAADAAGNVYLSDTLLPASANYPVKNSLAACNSAQSALTIFDNNGNLLQSTYLSAAPYPAGLLISPPSGLDLFSNGPQNNALTVIHFAPTPGAPTVPLACVGNAASYAPAISPGEIVSLFGNGLGPATGTQSQLTASGAFPRQLSGVTVTFNGIEAPLLYAQDGQINAIAPWALQPGAQATICVTYQSALPCFTTTVSQAQPGVFMLDPDHALALNQNGTLNGPNNPAKVGDVVSIFATGLGLISPQPADGALAQKPLPADLLPVTMAAVSPSSPGALVPLTVNYAGPAPGEVAGFSQINFTVTAAAGGPGSTYLVVGPSGSAVLSNPFFVYVAQ